MQSSTGSSHLYIASDMIADDVAIDGGIPDAGGPLIAARFTHITGRRAVRVHGKASSPTSRDAAAKTAIAECAKAATDAETVGARLRAGADGGGEGGLGELAVRSIGVRRAARAACAVAAVRAFSAGSKPEDLAALAAAEARFR
jgi:hypothetical protein